MMTSEFFIKVLLRGAVAVACSVWFAVLFVRQSPKITQTIVILDEQLLRAKIATERNQGLREKECANDSEARPNDSQPQSKKKTFVQLVSIQSLDLVNPDNGNVTAEPKIKGCIEECPPANFSPAGEGSSSSLNNRFVG